MCMQHMLILTLQKGKSQKTQEGINKIEIVIDTIQKKATKVGVNEYNLHNTRNTYKYNKSSLVNVAIRSRN